MTEWKARVFWKDVAVRETDGGWEITLDGRPVKTPGKSPMALPTRELAEAIAEEWRAQTDRIDPLTMPLTRFANSAIETVASNMDGLVEMLASYGETDLLCYRAERPVGLAARQAELWDSVLDWVEGAFGARLHPTAGVMHREQDPEALAKLRAEVAALDPFALAGFHHLVTLSGSLMLALAVLHGAMNAEEAFRLSRLDEDWQIAEWGEDEEAAALTADKRQAFVDAAKFIELTRA